MSRRVLSPLLSISALLMIGTIALQAQSATEPPSASLATLISEVRQLRQVVEESSRTQSQMQAIQVALAAQQSRLVQITTRLDAVRTELAAARVQAQALSRLLSSAADPSQPTSPADAAEASSMTRWFKQQADQAAERERQIRQQETDLLQAYQTEEARWTDLIGQLERLVRR